MDRQWVVGVDTDESSRGALILAKWLSGFSVRGSWDVRGVHVIREHTVRRRLSGLFGRSGEDEVRGAVAASIAEVRAANDLDAVDLVHTEGVEDGLIEACGPQTLGILIGRSAPPLTGGSQGLGKTARRLLRKMQCPLAIVPPDLELDRLRGSTLVIATDLSERCAYAAAFGRWLAHLTDLEPLLVYVGPDRYRGGGMVLRQGLQTRYAEALRLWSERYALGSIDQVARVGSTSTELLAVAQELSAAWIVCGSGPHSLWERLSHPSVSAEVAAVSPIPTVAVPPDLEGVYPWSRVPTLASTNPPVWMERSSIVP